MTFKDCATYFAVVVLTSAVGVCMLLGFMFAILPPDRYVGYSWAFVAFALITVVATVVGMLNQYEYELRKK